MAALTSAVAGPPAATTATTPCGRASGRSGIQKVSPTRHSPERPSLNAPNHPANPGMRSQNAGFIAPWPARLELVEKAIACAASCVRSPGATKM